MDIVIANWPLANFSSIHQTAWPISNKTTRSNDVDITQTTCPFQSYRRTEFVSLSSHDDMFNILQSLSFILSLLRYCLMPTPAQVFATSFATMNPRVSRWPTHNT